MKTRLRTLIGIGLMSALVFATPAAVFAEDANTTTTSNTTSSSEQETKETELTPEQKAEAKAALQERLEKRKTELKTKVSTAAQTRIKNRCVAAQGKITSVVSRVKGLETSRTEVHKNVLNRLTSLSEKLQAKGVDTTQLDAEITELKGLIDTFSTDLAAYKQAASDLTELDCTADPTAFQASLEASRTARTTAAASAKAVKTYMEETIKPTLKDIRAQLAGTAETKAADKETTETGGAQ